MTVEITELTSTVTTAPVTDAVEVAASTSTVEVALATAAQTVEIAAPPAEVLLVTVPTPEVVEVVVAGPQGPQGPVGATGPEGPGLGREFSFTSAATTWTAEHGLGFTPSVGIYSPLGVQIGGLVIENNESRTVVAFYFPTAGRLTLS